jgi:hypothetical protein
METSNETQQQPAATNGAPSTELAPAAGAPPAAQVMTIVEDDGGSQTAVNAFSSGSAFVAAQRMAKALASSSLVPKDYQNNIPNCLIAIEMASRVGCSVFAVMQNLDIIHGRPGWRSQFLIATVNACGRFTPLRFRWQGTPGKLDWGCRAVAKDKADGEECVGSLITMDTAKVEGWYDRGGSKWKTIPEQMLMYRAAAFWTRVYAPELSLGMHTADETEDIAGVEVGPKPLAAVPFSNDPANEGRRMSLGGRPTENVKPLDAEVVAASGAVPPSSVTEPAKAQRAKPAKGQQTIDTKPTEDAGDVPPHLREPGSEG